jgi:hypothetical protein
MSTPADVIPAALENCKRPYGELGLAFRRNDQKCYCMYDVSCESTRHGRRPYGEPSLTFRCNEQECYCMYDVSCESTRHGRSPFGEHNLAFRCNEQECYCMDDVSSEPTKQWKSPYGESSQVFHDIEQDCSHMSDTERKQTRQCLEHDSAYSHLNEGVVKTCLERCSTLNCTERSSVRKCLLAQKALCGEEYTPSVAVSPDSGAANTECLFVEDPTDTWVQQEETRGADRLPPFAHPNTIESTPDPEHTPQVVGMLNRELNKLAEMLNWENWAIKLGHYPQTSENLEPPEANTLGESDDEDGDLPQGSLKDLTRAAMLRMPHRQRKKFLIAEAKELKAIEDLEVIEGMVPTPKGVCPIGTRLVYATKDPVAQEGKKTERMAKDRLTMKDIKRGGDNLRETFAPTGQSATFRWLMMSAMCLHLFCDHIDVNTAFLYAFLSHPMYITGAPGRPCPPGYCLKVVKALYGCRKAPREWYQCLRDYIVVFGSVSIPAISWSCIDTDNLHICG